MLIFSLFFELHLFLISVSVRLYLNDVTAHLVAGIMLCFLLFVVKLKNSIKTISNYKKTKKRKLLKEKFGFSVRFSSLLDFKKICSTQLTNAS